MVDKSEVTDSIKATLQAADDTCSTIEAAQTEFDKYGNPPIDENLISMIESGDYELTDERFFELIKESHEYLGSKPFQGRIAKWKCTIGNEIYTVKERKQAKANLKKIGAVLAFEGQGAPEKFPDVAIYGQYRSIEKTIEIFLQKHKELKQIDLIKEFRSTFPEYSKFVDLKRHWSASEIAFDILLGSLREIKKYNISKRTLRAIIANPPKNLKERQIWNPPVIEKPE